MEVVKARKDAEELEETKKTIEKEAAELEILIDKQTTVSPEKQGPPEQQEAIDDS